MLVVYQRRNVTTTNQQGPVMADISDQIPSGPWGWVLVVAVPVLGFLKWLYTKLSTSNERRRRDVIELLHKENENLEKERQEAIEEKEKAQDALHRKRNELQVCVTQKAEITAAYNAQKLKIEDQQLQITELKAEVEALKKDVKELHRILMERHT